MPPITKRNAIQSELDASKAENQPVIDASAQTDAAKTAAQDKLNVHKGTEPDVATPKEEAEAAKAAQKTTGAARDSAQGAYDKAVSDAGVNDFANQLKDAESDATVVTGQLNVARVNMANAQNRLGELEDDYAALTKAQGVLSEATATKKSEDAIAAHKVEIADDLDSAVAEARDGLSKAQANEASARAAKAAVDSDKGAA